MSYRLTMICFALFLVSSMSHAFTPDQRHIKVSGHGKMEIVPDQVNLEAAWQQQGQSSSEALKALEKKFAKVMAVAEKKIPETSRLEARQVFVQPRPIIANGQREEIRSALIVQPQSLLNRRDNSRAAETRGYLAERRLRISDIPVEKVGVIAGQLAEMNPSQLRLTDYSSSHFELKEEIQSNALTKAIKNARQKAKAAAEASGLRLTGIIAIHEHPGHAVSYRNQAQFSAASARGANEAFNLSINPGTIEARASVTVYFGIQE